MATTTREVLRQRLSEHVEGPYFQEFTTTSIGNSGGTTLISTGIEEASQTNLGPNFWVFITSGNNANERRLVSAHTGSTITVAVAFSNQVASGVTFEVHKVFPDLKHNALNRASEELIAFLYAPIRDETLVVDQLLSNWDFETALDGGEHPSWNTNPGGSPTIAAETARVWHGSQSISIQTSSGVGSRVQDVSFQRVNMVGKSVTFGCRVWTNTASIARIGIQYLGSGDDIAYSDYHSGEDDWERLEVRATVPSDWNGGVRFWLTMASSSTTAYFDSAYAYSYAIRRYTVPTTIVEGPYRVEVQDNMDEGGTDAVFRSLGMDERPASGRILRLTGKAILSNLTADTSTVEIGPPQTELLLAQAIYYIYRNLQGDSSADQSRQSFYVDQEKRWEVRVEQLKARPSYRLNGMVAEHPRGWKKGSDSTSTYITFDY